MRSRQRFHDIGRRHPISGAWTRKPGMMPRAHTISPLLGPGAAPTTAHPDDLEQHHRLRHALEFMAAALLGDETIILRRAL